MKKLVLFDMDGTLTPHRKKMAWNVVSALAKLQKNGYEIGIITGSDMEYVKQQCDLLWDLSPVDYRVIHLLPCNGTKYYLGLNKTIWEYDMHDVIDDISWNKIMSCLIKEQLLLVESYPEIPLTGNFIQARGSMINWCPIGRNAKKQREKFIQMDKKFRIRSLLLTRLRERFDRAGVEVKLGGQTSFDIYPKGWDKSFIMDKPKFINNYSEYFFVGDRCGENGNDKALYDVIKNLKEENAFKTKGPPETIDIINKIIESGEQSGKK